jgi:hypothetical protein
MQSLQQREDSEACGYIPQPMERPSLQCLLWQASLKRLRAGRLDGIGRSEGEWGSCWDGGYWLEGLYGFERRKEFDGGAVGRGTLFRAGSVQKGIQYNRLCEMRHALMARA